MNNFAPVFRAKNFCRKIRKRGFGLRVSILAVRSVALPNIVTGGKTKVYNNLKNTQKPRKIKGSRGEMSYRFIFRYWRFCFSLQVVRYKNGGVL